ncbi:MAG: A/G-specific adenine glycosylase [Lentisphaeria bacterium]|nr:A/G-specific adenine glycosylase [Lentisphaeria bacterium]
MTTHGFSGAAVRALLSWFEKEQRYMPWREQKSAYRTWISEIMLQQTRVDTVIPYFNRFMKHFTDVYELANAKQDEVLKFWEGLGYYSRARKLHECAQVLVTDYHGVFPETYEELLKLPGLGPYTAAAITSIAFAQPVPVVDGNVFRVHARLYGDYDDISKPNTRKKVFEHLLEPVKVSKHPSYFNQGIMELGALICTPQNPNCTKCPVSKFCYAKSNKVQSELPVKKPKTKVPEKDVAIFLLEDEKYVLLQQRHEKKLLGKMWELPGSEFKDKPEEVLVKIKEQTGFELKVGKKLKIFRHAYSHFKVKAHLYEATHCGTAIVGTGLHDVQWVEKSNLSEKAFGKIALDILKYLKLRKA